MIIIDSLKNFYEEHEKGCKIVINILAGAVTVGCGICIGKKMMKGAVNQASDELVSIMNDIISGVKTGEVTYYSIYNNDEITNMTGCIFIDTKTIETQPKQLKIKDLHNNIRTIDFTN